MYSHILSGIAKIDSDAKALRYARLLERRGEILPYLDVLRKPAPAVVATCYIINAVSLLDEALESYISSKYSGIKANEVSTLGKRIKFLGKKSVLKDQNKLDQIRDLRNKYAHEIGQYGDWIELDQVLEVIKVQLQHIGIL